MDIEKVKKFWNDRQCNIKHSKKNIGTLEYFEEVEEKKYKVEPHIPEFANFSNWKGKKVLELGCGIGTDSINFARNGADLTCVELSEASIEICKKRFKEYGLNANFFVGNIEELSSFLPLDEYDLIYSFGVIHHTPNPKKVVSEIKKYCKEGTAIKIMLYSKISWKAIEFFILHGYKFNFNFSKTIQYFAEAQLMCPVAYTYTLNDLKSIFSDFKIDSIKKDHIFPYKINYYINHIYKKRLIFRILPKYLFKKLESVLGWHYLIDLKYENRGRNN